MAKFGDYCSSLEQVFYRELDADEHLIWTGKPYPGLMLRFNDFLLVPVSMLSCFVSFLTAKILFVHCNTTGFHSVSLIPDVFFFPAGLGFILVGLNMVLGRFFIDSMRRWRTYYAISNKRVIIVSTLFKPTTRSYFLNDLNSAKVVERRDGSGTIKLSWQDEFGIFAGENAWFFTGKDQLERIPKARTVYELLRQITV